MKVVVIIPAKDEQATIGEVLKRMPDFCSMIVVDDGSVDHTVEIAKSFGAKVISHKKSQGVGVAFKTGLLFALEEKADIIVNMDADGQMPPEYIPNLIAPIIYGKADVTIATRFYGNHMKDMPLIKKIGNNIFTFLVRSITGENLTDTQCGFRAYTKDAAKKMHIFGKFTYTQEAIMDIAEKGLKIEEVKIPILAQRPFGKSKVVKNFFSYGTKASMIMMRAVRDYEPLKFFGTPGLICLIAGLALNSYVVLAKIFFDVSIFEHNTWKLFFGSLLMVFGLFCLVFAFLADMLVRHRKMLEEVLYRLR
jgi:glycosyltransferase involved in cell wall biosynthesis